MRTFLVPTALATALLACLYNPAHAQRFGGYELDRGLSMGAYTPYDGMPYSHRYNYYRTGEILYLNGNPQQLYYLDYLDKVRRAEMFGYPMPPDPFENPQVIPPPRGRLGFGAGFYRFR